MEYAIDSAVADWLQVLSLPHYTNVHRICVVVEQAQQVTYLLGCLASSALGVPNARCIDVVLYGAQTGPVASAQGTDGSGARHGLRFLHAAQALQHRDDSGGYDLIVALCPNRLFFDASEEICNLFASALRAVVQQTRSSKSTASTLASSTNAAAAAETTIVCIEPRSSALTGVPALRSRLLSSLSSIPPSAFTAGRPRASVPNTKHETAGSHATSGAGITQALKSIATASGQAAVAFESATLHSFVRLTSARTSTGSSTSLGTAAGTAPSRPSAAFGVQLPTITRQVSYGYDELSALGELLHVDVTAMAVHDPTACAAVRAMLAAQSLYNVLKAQPKRGKGKKGWEAAPVSPAAPPPGGAIPRPEYVDLALPLDICLVALRSAIHPSEGQEETDAHFSSTSPALARSLLMSTCPAVMGSCCTRSEVFRRGYTLAYALRAPSGHSAGLACWQECRADWTRKPAGWSRPRKGSKRGRSGEDETGAGRSTNGHEAAVWFDASGADFIAMAGPAAMTNDDDSDDEYGGLSFDEVVEALVADGPGGIEDAPSLPHPLPLRTVLDLFSECWEETWEEFEENEQEKEGRDEGWG